MRNCDVFTISIRRTLAARFPASAYQLINHLYILVRTSVNNETLCHNPSLVLARIFELVEELTNFVLSDYLIFVDKALEKVSKPRLHQSVCV